MAATSTSTPNELSRLIVKRVLSAWLPQLALVDSRLGGAVGAAVPTTPTGYERWANEPRPPNVRRRRDGAGREQNV